MRGALCLGSSVLAHQQTRSCIASHLAGFALSRAVGCPSISGTPAGLCLFPGPASCRRANWPSLIVKIVPQSLAVNRKMCLCHFFFDNAVTQALNRTMTVGKPHEGRALQSRFEAILGGHGATAKLARATGRVQSGLHRVWAGSRPVPPELLAIVEFLEVVPQDQWPERWR